MLRNVLILVLVILVARALARTLGGMVAGASRQAASRRGSGSQTQSVHMVRDPVCGTYVVPERAIAYADGSRQLFFCSATCRDRYRAHPAEGRTA